MNDLHKWLAMMEDVISSYDLNSDIKQLGNFVRRLEEILSMIDDPNEFNWKQEMLRNWGALEDVYADALYTKRSEIPEDHIKIMKPAISKLKRLINERKSM